MDLMTTLLVMRLDVVISRLACVYGNRLTSDLNYKRLAWNTR